MTSERNPVQPDLATTFAALGDPRRLAIVTRLQQQDALSISALCEGTDVSRQAISKHLKTLAEAQLVSSERTGRETRFSLEPARLRAATAFLNQVALKWDDALNRLKSHLE
ncbi:metalloregulator ArsR/SmtB family transcription factor [Cognatiyoonia sp. IB215182]|uniref:ArsR/SmtB family transcription factor n=1 Tax=Cognatiyoonia sp. IB215182 TaxID=3097353 RepID=UPI002A15E973|nr:metalloregulator ArsR/SmtB family transcription factor [Cognatiyoonia sp. IB215182]MDX8355587.1 metalloregulator ArsR/SmtB family transcription factor [Cognatiyoonia sp. IB215182]